MTSCPALDPSRLDAVALTGLRVEVVPEAGSTNAVVATRARSGAAEGLVVVAEHQTAGRGRLDRTWVTPPRSALTLSVLLRPTAPAARWPWLPLLAGHAVVKALAASGFPARLKWPNDVLLDELKVAGVLSEVVEAATPAGPPAVVLGIGLNVATTADELPVPTATSLLVSGGPDRLPDRTDLLALVLQTLWEGYQAWQEGGESGTRRLAASYAAACATIGQQVRAELPAGGTLTGTAEGIDDAGRLLVDGVPVGAGDVVHVRPA